MATRVALVGNCQIASIGRALRFFAPHVHFDLLSTFDFTPFQQIDALAAALREYDCVFCQDFEEGAIAGGDSVALGSLVPGVIRFPPIFFLAFHPDIVYLQLREADGSLSLAKSPLGDYHSALILYGFLNECSREHTRRLFDEAVLRKVGYLDLWAPAQEQLLAAGQKASMPLDSLLMIWARRGCFMHSINHPKLFVLADIARTLLRRAALPFRDEDSGSFLVDGLMDSIIWPVYPDIGRHLGCPGSYTFKKHEAEVFFDLDELIGECYRSYGELDRERVVCSRIDLWRGDASTAELMRSRPRRR